MISVFHLKDFQEAVIQLNILNYFFCFILLIILGPAGVWEPLLCDSFTFFLIRITKTDIKLPTFTSGPFMYSYTEQCMLGQWVRGQETGNPNVECVSLPCLLANRPAFCDQAGVAPSPSTHTLLSTEQFVPNRFRLRKYLLLGPHARRTHTRTHTRT